MGLTPFSMQTVAAAVPPTLTYIGTVSSTTNATSYTFSSTAIGDADATRKVVIAVNIVDDGTNGTITVTVGGNTMTLDVSVQQNRQYAAIYSLDVAAGTTAEFIVTSTQTNRMCSLSVYSVTGTNSVGATASGGSAFADNIDVDMNVLEDDAIISCANIFQTATAPQWTHTGTVEDMDLTVDYQITAGSLLATAGATPLAINLKTASSATAISGVACAYRA